MGDKLRIGGLVKILPPYSLETEVEVLDVWGILMDISGTAAIVRTSIGDFKVSVKDIDIVTEEERAQYPVPEEELEEEE